MSYNADRHAVSRFVAWPFQCSPQCPTCQPAPRRHGSPHSYCESYPALHLLPRYGLRVSNGCARHTDGAADWYAAERLISCLKSCACVGSAHRTRQRPVRDQRINATRGLQRYTSYNQCICPGYSPVNNRDTYPMQYLIRHHDPCNADRQPYRPITCERSRVERYDNDGLLHCADCRLHSDISRSKARCDTPGTEHGPGNNVLGSWRRTCAC